MVVHAFNPIPVLRWQRLMDLSESKASLVYIASTRLQSEGWSQKEVRRDREEDKQTMLQTRRHEGACTLRQEG